MILKKKKTSFGVNFLKQLESYKKTESKRRSLRSTRLIDFAFFMFLSKIERSEYNVKNFMYGTELEDLEQMMMLIPNCKL